MSATQDRLQRLEEALREVRIELRALKFAFMGAEPWHKTGYGWALRDAERAERQIERERGERFIAGADLSDGAVLAACGRAVADTPDGRLRARDVAVALFPPIMSPDAPGRQLLIARVGAKMRDLVETGALVRVAEPHGRMTSRYALVGAVGAS
jgi:hypothetical protein